MNKFFSIIIPIFNNIDYIEKCVNSINQINTNIIEILIIDDCSFDKSYELIKKKYKNIDHIKIFRNKKNIGLGETRNKGILNSKGEYLLFLDSDDQLKINDLNKLREKISKLNSEIILFNYEINLNQSNYIENDIDEIKNTNLKNYKKLIKHRPSWSIIYKRSFLIKNNLFFKRAKYEDHDFYINVITKARYVSQSNDILITYNKNNPNSITNNLMTNKDIGFIYDQFNSALVSLNQIKIEKDLVYYEIIFLFSRFIFFLKNNIDTFTNSELKMFQDFFQKNKIDIEKINLISLKDITYNRNKNIFFLYYLFIEFDIDLIREALSKNLSRSHLTKIIKNKFIYQYLLNNKEIFKLFRNEKNYQKITFPKNNIKKVYIHIGLPKTGTTSVQNFLFKNREELINFGFLYPETITSKNFIKGNKLIGYNSLNDHNFIHDMKNYGYEFHDIFFLKLIEEIKNNNNCDKLIISSENLIFAEKDFIKKIRSLFMGKEIKIIFTQRDYINWLNSYYYETIFSGRSTWSFSKFFNKMKSEILPYNKKINLWINIFNKKSFNLIEYNNNEKYIKNILNLFEIPTDIIEKYKYCEEYRDNKSPFNLQLLVFFNLSTKNLSFSDFIKQKKIFLNNNFIEENKDKKKYNYINKESYHFIKDKLENIKNKEYDNQNFFDTSFLDSLSQINNLSSFNNNKKKISFTKLFINKLITLLSKNIFIYKMAFWTYTKLSKNALFKIWFKKIMVRI